MGITDRAPSGLRIVGLLLVVVAAAACAVAYGVFVVEQRQYFTDRNFRLLSTLATQFDNTVRAEARVIASLAGDAGEQGNILKSWVSARQARYPATDIQFEKARLLLPNATAEYAFEPGPELRLRVHGRPRGESGDPTVVARLKMARVLDPIFTARKAQGAFDTLVLATQEGDVLYASGRRVNELRSSGLATLGRSGAQPRPFSDLVRTTAVDDVSVAGVEYKLFIQPCCMPTLAGGKPLVLAGLVESDALRSQSWAISTTLVKLAVMAMLIALIGWPFLKLALIGDRQKVRVSDLFQLGASSVAGLAIVTIVMLDAVAYWQLNRDTDAQLERLANSLDRNATAEIADAYRQLSCLDRRTKDIAAATRPSVLADPSFVCEPETAPPALSSLALQTGQSTARKLPWPYPFFEAFSLVDPQGVQKVKLATADSVPSAIDLSERPYFQTAVKGRGWHHDTMCPPPGSCSFESVWSWTTAEPLAVLAKRRASTDLPVATISIPMRSLIRPVLPPGFEFAVIDHTGKVLFHSDRHRNVSENFFEETDDNRRLRAQISAHSAEPVSIRYWGAAYRAYVKPMELPDAYVVAMAQKQRAWAINREWLVVALIFLAGYLGVWLVVALATLVSDASWIWPDPARRVSYYGVSALCLVLLAMAAAAAWHYDRNSLAFWGVALPLAGWIGTRLILRRPRAVLLMPSREPVGAYSVAAVLLLLVSGVVPGALLFLASFHLHAQSYIKNSQLLIARALSERVDRLNEDYSNSRGDGKAAAQTHIDLINDRDLYFDALYGTCVREHWNTGDDIGSCPAAAPHVERLADDEHDSDMLLSFLEDYLPYYSEASVEWRELLHDRSDDATWFSQPGPDGNLTLTVTRRGNGAVALTSRIPTLRGSLGSLAAGSNVATVGPQADLEAGSQAVSTSGTVPVAPQPALHRDRPAILMGLAFGLVLIAVTWGLVHIFLRYIFLVGVTEPLWASVRLAVNAGDNIFVLCDEQTKARQIAGTVPLKLGPIARETDVRAAWRKALIGLDRRNQGGAVLVDDFDEDLEDTSMLDAKLALLEELVADPSRTVVLLSQLSPTGLSDSLRQSTRGLAIKCLERKEGEPPAPEASGEPPDERWRRVLKVFVLVEWRDIETQLIGAPATAVTAVPGVPDQPHQPQPARDAVVQTALPARSSRLAFATTIAALGETLRMGPVRALLDAEGRSHPFVNRVCAELRQSEAAQRGQLTREQALDEIEERAAQCYRNIWTSCSEDEKVVLSHIAQHGLANASVRTVVRRLLGRRLLHKDPALRPMNETFRRFVLSKECWRQVTVLETAGGPSAWDRLRVPLAVGVVGVGVFLFATQKELYNAILGVTTAAAVSVPTLIRAIGLLAGRRPNEGEKA
jgi:hypothetical protein